MATIIQKLKNGISDLKKDIEYYLDIEKVDIDDIEPMRYPEDYTGPRPQHIPPWTLKNRSELLKYRRR